MRPEPCKVQGSPALDVVQGGLQIKKNSPSDRKSQNPDLFSAGQEAFQGGEIFVHVSQPLGDAHGHAPVKFAGHGRVFVEEGDEGGNGDYRDLAVLHGCAGSGTETLIEKGHLSHVAPAAQLNQFLVFPLPGFLGELQGPQFEKDQGVPRFAFLEDGLPLGYLGLAGDTPDLLQFFLAKIGEEQKFF
jgi:hypothetical protein